MKTVTEQLQSAIDLFEQRNAEYGNCYTQHGTIMKAFFPQGVTILTEADFDLWNKFENVVGKCARIASAISAGDTWHEDSSRDIIVYSAMALERISQMKKGNKK